MITKKLKKTKKNNKSRSIYKHTSINKSKNISSNTFKYTSKIPNNKIINILTIVKNYYEKQNDKIHVNAYERAIYQIKHWGKPITKGSELSDLIGIGKGMIEKIDTIIKTGTLPIIKEKGLDINLDTYSNNIYLDTRNNKTNKKLQNNSNPDNIDNIRILGFGNTIIKELKLKYNARTINDIRNLVDSNKIKLNNTQTIGLKYYEDLISPIPRNEITKIGNKIKVIIEKYSKFLTCFIAGSYPSETKETSKDIDILIVINDNVTHKLGMYSKIIKQISKQMSLETISLGNEKFLGLIKSPISGKWRHLDIRLTLIDNLPYAWLYYTSGKIFNKIIRERLHKKGYKLNEYGLYKNGDQVDLEKDNDQVNLDNNKLDKFGIKDGMLNINEKQMMQYTKNIEKKIFKIADLEYKSVKERY
jgi:DNA polymerase/3'-5' exonuclease PolX